MSETIIVPPPGAAGRRLGYKGIYINLDRSEERRRKLQSQLQKYGLAEHYVRFPAVDSASIQSGDSSSIQVGAPLHPQQTEIQAGEIACFRSHYLALNHASLQRTCIHIMEDDVLLSEYVPLVIDALHSNGITEKYDIIFTEMGISKNARTVGIYKQSFDEAFCTDVAGQRRPQFKVFDGTKSYAFGMTSYVVGPTAIERLLQALKRGLDDGPKLPIDIHIKKEALEGNLRLGCIFPFITACRLEHIAATTIGGRSFEPHPLSNQIDVLLRYSFFVNCDFTHYAKPLIDEMKRAKAERGHDPHHDVLVQILEFLSSTDYHRR